MNKEMGELYAEPDTGEVVRMMSINFETGEEEYQTIYPSDAKKSFRIPRYCIPEPQKLEKPFRSSENRLEFITAVVFLIPTMILFYPLLGSLVLTFEIILHVWCHRKNNKLVHKLWYYRSPLNVISKEFCNVCKAEITSLKINKIQDIRHNRFRRYGLDPIRSIVT